MIKVGKLYVDVEDFLEALTKALDEGKIIVHVHEDEVVFHEREELLN